MRAVLAGNYSHEAGATFCHSCPAHATTSAAGSDNVTDCRCDAGYTGPDGGECTACPAGTYKDTAGSVECTTCVAGKYKDTTGSGECTACPAGKYEDSTGSAECSSCPSNSTSAAERASCFCNAGYWNVKNCSNLTHNTIAECTSRHVGKLITLGRGPCMACDPGAQH